MSGSEFLSLSSLSSLSPFLLVTSPRLVGAVVVFIFNICASEPSNLFVCAGRDVARLFAAAGGRAESFAAVLGNSWRTDVRPESQLGDNNDDDIAACTLLEGARHAEKEKTRPASLLLSEVGFSLSLTNDVV